MNIVINITFHQRQMLRLVAERSGRITFKYGVVTIIPDKGTDEEQTKQARAADDSVRDMVTKGLLKSTDIIGQTNTVWLELTDIGRNIIDQMGIKVT